MLRYIFIVVGIFLINFYIVSTGKSKITITQLESWISTTNISIMIQESLNRSKCSNVHISGNSVAIEMIFDDFTRIYKNAYVIINESLHCDGYLLISTSATQLIPVLEKKVTKKNIEIPMKTEKDILIIVDDDVNESSGLFNLSVYDLASVNIATRNGIWTLSENYFDPRDFKKITRYEEMTHKRGVANFHYRELQVAAFYQPPFCYLRKTVNRTVNGVETEFFVANDNELDGVETKIFLLLAEQLNFTWTIRTPNHHYRYGRRNGSNWYGGMIGQIWRKEVDIAFTNIWIFLDQYEFVNMSYPWSRGQVFFLVPRPKPLSNIWALETPFSWQVWTAILIMLLAQSIYIYIAAWINPKIPARFRNYFITLTELMGQLLGVWIPKKIQGLKLQLKLWHFVGILLVTAYSSNLAARLTNTPYEKRIDTLKDFIEANLTWGREKVIPIFANYFDVTDPYGKQFEGRFELERNEAERHEKILKKNYAIIGRKIGRVFYPENFVTEEDLKGYRIMKEHTTEFMPSFAVQPWLLDSVNKAILRLKESGLVQYHLRDVIHRQTGRELREVLIDHDVDLEIPRVLHLIPLSVGFGILIVGLTISTVVFFLELKHISGKKKKSIRQIIREIEDNHRIWEIRKISKKLRHPDFGSFQGKKYGFYR